MKVKMILKAMGLTSILILSHGEAATKSQDLNQGEAITASSEVKAKVKDIDYKTRDVTLQTENGEEVNFIAGEKIKNLNQVKKGDTVVVNYAEAVVFEIKKGGKASPPSTTEVTESARPGSNPEGLTAREVTATVLITEIDKKKPAVTIKNADGDTETFKVRHPERLEGVKVGDTVVVTYLEALGMKLEKAKM